MGTRVMSPNAPGNEIAGMELAERLLLSPCRINWSARQVLSFGEEGYKRLVAAGNAEKADGFRRMAVILAGARAIRRP